VNFFLIFFLGLRRLNPINAAGLTFITERMMSTRFSEVNRGFGFGSGQPLILFVQLCFFGFLVCYADTQLARQLQQERIQVVRTNTEAQKRLTESNSTPAMDLGRMNVGLEWCTCVSEV